MPSASMSEASISRSGVEGLQRFNVLCQHFLRCNRYSANFTLTLGFIVSQDILLRELIHDCACGNMCVSKKP